LSLFAFRSDDRPRALHSFPPRRSSDLEGPLVAGRNALRQLQVGQLAVGDCFSRGLHGHLLPFFTLVSRHWMEIMRAAFPIQEASQRTKGTGLPVPCPVTFVSTVTSGTRSARLFPGRSARA